MFQHYDEYVSYGDSTEALTPLTLGVTKGIFGAATNPGLHASSLTHLCDSRGGARATGVSKIRFVFYAVGILNSAGSR